MTIEQVEQLSKAFANLDANGEGLISRDELSNLLQGLGPEIPEEAIQSTLNAVVWNSDGLVQFEEFLNAVLAGLGNKDEELQGDIEMEG